MLIRNVSDCANIVAWPVPNINAKITVHDLPTLLTATLPTRLSFSFTSRDDELSPELRLEIRGTVLARLPLDGLGMFDAHELTRSSHGDLNSDLQTQDFWRHLSPNWPLLRCVRLAAVPAARGFLAMLLEGHGERKGPLLPSLTQLAIVTFRLDQLSLLPLREALMKRNEQGVPVETLDLQCCTDVDHIQSQRIGFGRSIRLWPMSWARGKLSTQ
jgi:hypothetical protein